MLPCAAEGRAAAGRPPAAVRGDVVVASTLAASDAAARARAAADTAAECGAADAAARARAAADTAAAAAARAAAARAAADTADVAAANLAADASHAARVEPVVSAAIAAARAAMSARAAAAADAAARAAAGRAANCAAAADAAAHAAGRAAAGRAGDGEAWARAAEAFAARAAAGAEWLRTAAGWHEKDVAPRAQSTLTRRAFEVADMADLNAAVARAAADDAEYAAAAGDALCDRARLRWLHVAARLPPDIRARFAGAAPIPGRPARGAGVVRRAADVAADLFGAAAGACIPVRAGLSRGAAAAVRAACPAPAPMVEGMSSARVVDLGARFVHIGRFSLPASGSESCYMRPGPLSDAFVADICAGGRDGAAGDARAPVRLAPVRLGVDLLGDARGGGRPRDDDGYEYGRGTWADAAANEQVDLNSTARYEEAIAEGRWAGDMLPGIELPGSLFGRRRTCGEVSTLGCIGEAGGAHAGRAIVRRGTMGCNSRACLACWTRWKDAEAHRIAGRIEGAVAMARLEASGAPARRTTAVSHVVVSLPPEEQAAWESGPEERARLRAAAVKELELRCDWFFAACALDHGYRYTAGLEHAKSSPHLHFILIGWLNYELNRDRFLEFRDMPYEVRRMPLPGGGAVERRYGRMRGMFVKRLSGLDSYEEYYGVADYGLSHCTACARRLGETSGGEHAVRWYGMLANGRMNFGEVSRHERGDLIANSGVDLPAQITSLRAWHVTAPNVGGDTVTRAAPRHVFEGGGGHAERAAALDAAAAALQKVHPASAKSGGVLSMACEPTVELLEVDTDDVPVDKAEVPIEVVAIADDDGAGHVRAARSEAPDDYLVLQVAGHSRPAAAAAARQAGEDAAAAARVMRTDVMLGAAAAAADVSAAAADVSAAAAMIIEVAEPPAAGCEVNPAGESGAAAERIAKAIRGDASLAAVAGADDVAVAADDVAVAAGRIGVAAVHRQADTASYVADMMSAAHAHLAAAVDRIAAGRRRLCFDTPSVRRLRTMANEVEAASRDVAGAGAMIEELGARRPAGAPDDMVKAARARLRAAAGHVAAAKGSIDLSDGPAAARLSNVVAAVGRAAAAVGRAAAASKEKSRWVVMRVHSGIGRLCPLCGARLRQIIWDPGGPGPPILPQTVAAGIGLGAVEGAPGGAAADGPPAGWIAMPVAGKYVAEGGVEVGYQWADAVDWMKTNHAPHLPAWDKTSRELLVETGELEASPHIGRMAAPVQGAVLWDVLYTKVRADMVKARDAAREEGGVYYRITREMVVERVRKMHSRAPVAPARRQA